MRKFHTFNISLLSNMYLYGDYICIYCGKSVYNLYKSMNDFQKDEYPKLGSKENILKDELYYLAEHAPRKNGISENEFIIKQIIE